jgi:glycosyltransferase involved in cell wall biosynthesis
MRIAFIHPFLFRLTRGIERFLFNLANALARQGAEIEVLTWRWSRPVVLDALDPRVRVRTLPTARYFAAWCMIPWYTYYLVKEKYDFVWIFFAGYGEAESLALASLVRAVPYGVSLHFPYSLVPHRYREFRRLGCIGRARRVVATSQHVADGVREAFDLPSTIIRTGVDPAAFQRGPGDKEAARRILGLEMNDAVVLTVAALENRKGIQHVLRALPAMRAAGTPVKYLVAGEGPSRKELEEEIDRLDLREVVRLVGSTTDILPFYRAADVFALLSHGEAAPIAPLEAMSIGLPLVVARQKPFDEIVTPECGVMVNEADSAEVAQTLSGFLADPARAQAAGAAGRERVCREFTWERIAEQYLAQSRY